MSKRTRFSKEVRERAVRMLVVGSNKKSAYLYVPFVWTRDHGMVKIESDLQGGTNGYAWGVNADGSVVVGQDDVVLGGEFDLGQFCLRWESYGAGVPGGAPELFQSGLPDPLYPTCGAFGVSDDGSTVVGWAYGASGQEAFRRTVEDGTPTMVGLGDLAGGAFRSIARDASADGSTIVGFSNSALGEEAFVWTNGSGMVSIGGGTATSITPDGLTVVGYSHIEAFRWTSGDGMVGLGVLPPGEPLKSQAHGVSADGSVVVGDTRDGVLAVQAFIWDATNGMRSLQTVLTNLGVNLTGWTLLSAQDVSDDGNVIAGYGTNPSGGREAWVVDLLPEPSSTILQGAALILLAGLAAGRRSWG